MENAPTDKDVCEEVVPVNVGEMLITPEEGQLLAKKFAAAIKHMPQLREAWQASTASRQLYAVAMHAMRNDLHDVYGPETGEKVLTVCLEASKQEAIFETAVKFDLPPSFVRQLVSHGVEEALTNGSLYV